jgi:signal transduction histidine kinase
MKTKSLLSRKVQLAFGSAILALLVVGAISYRGMAVSSESDRWVRHTHEVLENLQDLLSAMQSAESSYRAFVLTGTESYLDLYRASMLRSEQENTIIRDLTVDNALQQRKIAALEMLATQKNQYAVSVIALRRTKGLEAAADSIRDGGSQRVMDEYRGVIREMQDEELRLLALRDAEAKRRLGQTKTILILGTVLGALIAAAAGWSAQRDSSRRGLAEEALLNSEDHLQKKVNELNRSNQELQQFAYVASHDLQEPLRMVASYTQLLAQRYKGRLDSDADEFIAYAVDGSNRMQGLIQDLLVYSRAGANGKALREISSEKALKEALTNLRAAIEESGAVVTHDSLPAITTDDTQLTQIFQNLVGNAIKYRSAEVPRIHVSAAKNAGNEWIFSVRDNGLGIAPQYFDRIFIIFQRLHGRTEFKGTGIGLSICKKIVERLGGRIWVESQPEKGSTFYFALPERDGK